MEEDVLTLKVREKVKRALCVKEHDKCGVCSIMGVESKAQVEVTYLQKKYMGFVE